MVDLAAAARQGRVAFADLDRVAFDRFGVLAAGGDRAAPAKIAVACAELARVGVRVLNPEAITEEFAAALPEFITYVRARRGDRGEYEVFSPLFAGFPDKLPASDSVRVRRILGYSRLFPVLAAASASLPDGVWAAPTDDMVRTAFDFRELGWWPASSVPQIPRTAVVDRRWQRHLKPDGHVEWLTVRIIDTAERDGMLREWMTAVFAAPSAPREDAMNDLRALIGQFSVDHVAQETVRFRELKTLLIRAAWDKDPASIARFEATPDDLLRLLADIAGSDIALIEPVKFPKLTRTQRRALVATLEATPRLSDVFRYRGLWLAITRGLHLSEFNAPRTQGIFARLRASKHDSSSTLSRFEAALAAGQVEDAFGVLADKAPSVLARQMRRLAARADGDPDAEKALCDALANSSGSIPVKLLAAATAQLADNGTTYPRAAITGGGDTLLIDHRPGHLAVTGRLADTLQTALNHAIHTQLAAKTSWTGQRVWVAPECANLLVPDGIRNTSAGLMQLERGSRLPVHNGKVLRLFTHWTEPEGVETDLDLSAITFDADMNMVGQVSWTNLRAGEITHSGDLTSAPAGAQEFIDIDLNWLTTEAAQHGWAYIAPVVFRYSGARFDQIDDASVGWMLRDQPTRNRMVFDPATVQNCFPLTSNKRTAVPFLYNITEREIIYVDVYLFGEPHASTERDGHNIGIIAKAVADRHHTKWSIYDLVRKNIHARGASGPVDTPETADITIGLGPDHTYNALQPEHLLADLL
ncbi:hypothetical protein [Microbacterium maritypicum]